MGEEWRDCVVTLIDVIGVKKLKQVGEASKLMLGIHALVVQHKPSLSSVVHAYVWNDSALLLSYVNKQNASFETALREAETLKRRIDNIAPSYAISVKGKSFPSQLPNGSDCGVTVISASSWAMANCFEIEA